MSISQADSRGSSAAWTFAWVALVYAMIVFLLLTWWAGGLESLGWIGVAGWWHILILLAVTWVSGRVATSLMFRVPTLDRSSGALRGASVMFVGFLAVLTAHGAVLLFITDAKTAVWLLSATALFGGIVFGIPATILGAITGAYLSD